MVFLSQQQITNTQADGHTVEYYWAMKKRNLGMDSTSSVGFTASAHNASCRLRVVIDKYLGGEQGGASAAAKAGHGEVLCG